MQKMRPALVWFLFILSLGCASSTFGQVATGTPPFGSYGGGPDVLNLANLNAHITVPVLHKSGRGTGFAYDLIYDSSVWTPLTSGSTVTWQPVANWGWGATTQVATGYLTATSTIMEECGYYNVKGFWIHTGNVYDNSNWTYHDKFGVSHLFSGISSTSGAYCPAPTYFTSVATDGSGYTLQVQASGTTVIARNGTNVLPQTNSGTGSSTMTDRNGNQISVSTSGVFTDTLGTAALSVSGGPPNAMIFAYTAPSGAAAQYTIKYVPYTIQTNFNCSGIGEYSAPNVSLVTEIDLPDISVNPNDKYTFAYEATPGHSGDVTGRLASVTLPTGGTISYAYSGGNTGTGILCADGSTATLTRTTPDGTWTYAHSETGTAWTTIVTDPQSNQTNMSFQGIYETERQVYQGSATLLKTLIACYNGNTSSCNTTAITLPITQRTVTLQWPGSGGKQSQIKTLYNSFGLVTEGDQYDYASGGPGALVRQTLTTYANLGNNISGRPATLTVKDGSGNIKAQTTYSYDQGSVTATSSTPQHVSVSGSRGNVTTISSLVQGSTTLSKTFTYYDTGTVAMTTDVNGAQTTYTYGSGSCGNSFVTSVTEPLNLSKSVTINCTGGVALSTTDENGKTASVSYNDAYFWRKNSATDAVSNVTNVTYNSANQAESSLLFPGGSASVDVLSTLDSLGRSHISQVRQGPSSNNFDSVESDFDSLGRPSRGTLPYSGTAGQTNSSGPQANATYDALGRKIGLTNSGGLNVTLSYSQNDAYQSVGPAPTGENAKRKQVEYDALGRITSVCEITNGTGSGTCGQTNTATGFWTQYTYDVLGDLTGVTQNAQSGNKQTRSYSYDDLGRMTQEINPETGTTAYTYDTDSTCGTYSGNLVKKADAVGNVTCFAYDALHRHTSVIVSSGPYAPSTPKKYFVYDLATVNSAVMVNVKARMAEAYTCTSPCTSKITDVGFSYTALGKVSDVYQSTVHSSGYYHLTASYWANGAVNQLSNLVGLPTITYNVDGEGRVYSVSASSGQNPVTSATYNTASLPTAINLGSLDSDTYTFDPNTNRINQYKFNVNGQSIVGTPAWNAIGTLASLNVTDPFFGGGNQSCTYSHDDLTRIASANCGTVWSQTFSYDAFGNLSKSGTQSFLPTYAYVTNHITQVGSSTPSYDLNGNLTNDTIHTYSWDAAGRPVTIDTVNLTYDALGRMVEQNRSGTYTEIVYSPTGRKLALMSGQTLQKAFVPLPGGSAAVYTSSGLAYYRHSDWLGSSRFASTSGRGMYFDGAYAPFGEPYAQTGTTDVSFTGMNQDTVSGLYDFAAREYSIQGRWPSPDPSGIASVGLKDPQTWNRYAYVRNSPLHEVDPQGLKPGLVCGDGVCASGDGVDDNTIYAVDGVLGLSGSSLSLINQTGFACSGCSSGPQSNSQPPGQSNPNGALQNSGQSNPNDPPDIGSTGSADPGTAYWTDLLGTPAGPDPPGMAAGNILSFCATPEACAPVPPLVQVAAMLQNMDQNIGKLTAVMAGGDACAALGPTLCTLGVTFGTMVLNQIFNPNPTTAGISETGGHPLEADPNEGGDRTEPAPISGPPVAGGPEAP
jgi:RHS repeat-associated protein